MLLWASEWTLGSFYSWTLTTDPGPISYCASYDLCDVYYVIQATSESYLDSSGSAHCFDFPGPAYDSGPWEITFDMHEDFTFTKWRTLSHATYPAGDMSLYYYDSASATYIEVSGSDIAGTSTGGYQESGTFDAVTASTWKMVITSAHHTYQLYVCEVQFYGIRGSSAPVPTPIGAAADSYGILLYSNGYGGTTVDIGETTFNANFWSSSELILKRLCSTCLSTHVTVGIKYLVLLFSPSAEYKAPVHCVCPDLLQAAHGV
jgi:hypothetical protein